MEKHTVKTKICILLTTIILAVMISVTSCSGSETEAMRTLKQNEKKWAEQSQFFKQSYTYTIHIGCFCPEDITSAVSVLVTSGKTESVVYTDDGTPATHEVFATVDTIEDLFDIIRKAIDNEVDELIVEYDPNLGYPASISIDPIKTAVDEERGYTILDFAILK